MTHDAFSTDALAALSPRDQRTVIGHASHDLMSPLCEDAVATLIDRLGPVDRLLDVGSGKGAFARRAVGSGLAASALCIERNPVLAAHGQRRAEREGVAERIEWVVGDVGHWRSSERFDGVAVLGSSQALGGLAGALTFAVDRLSPGGRLVLGEPIWVAPPPPEYLRFLGTDGSETPTPEVLAAAVSGAGLRVEYVHRSTAEEWAAYEDPYFAALSGFTTADGERPYAAQAQAFAAMQVRHGRAAMGFETVIGVRA